MARIGEAGRNSKSLKRPNDCLFLCENYYGLAPIFPSLTENPAFTTNYNPIAAEAEAWPASVIHIEWENRCDVFWADTR